MNPNERGEDLNQNHKRSDDKEMDDTPAGEEGTIGASESEQMDTDVTEDPAVEPFDENVRSREEKVEIMPCDETSSKDGDGTDAAKSSEEERQEEDNIATLAPKEPKAEFNDTQKERTKREDDEKIKIEETPEKKSKNDTLPPTSSGRLRRKMQNVSYTPENFKVDTVHQEVKILPGRGVKLMDIPSVKKNIEKMKNNDYLLAAAFKFLDPHPKRGRGLSVHKKLLKSQILEFSGFLPNLSESMRNEEVKVSDNEEREKLEQRAYKMQVPHLKAISDVFDVDRRPTNGKAFLTKEELVNRLVEFICIPNIELTKSGKKESEARKRSRIMKNSPKTKKRSKGDNIALEAVVVESDDSDGSEDINEDDNEKSGYEKGSIPSDKKLRKWVKAYIACFNLEKATTKHAIQTASDKFGVDVSEKKGRIKELITEAINERG